MRKTTGHLIFIGYLLILITLPCFYAADDDFPAPPRLKFVRIGVRQGFQQGAVTSILQDSKEFMWLGTYNGLVKYNGCDFTFYKYRHNDPNTLGHKYIYCIYQDREGLLWIGTYETLDKFDPARETFTHYRISSGTPPITIFSNVNSVLESLVEPGILWLGTGNGLGKLDKETGAFIIDRYFAEYSEGLKKPRVFSMVESPPGNYNRTERNQYAYKMEGFDDDWQKIGKRRMVTFTSLSPGTYNFKVKGSNNDGLWNEEGTSVRVIISPPWWRALWAYGLHIILLVLILVGLNRLQRARLIKKERDQAKIQEAQLRAKAAEAEGRAIEAENKRKTHELEEARNFQLSMLPKKLPRPPGFDISVYMKTAYEVGGDYNDFFETADGTLTIAVGDATGHGLKAGILVSMLKGLFLNEAGDLQTEIHAFFNKSNHTIKQMHLGNLFMGLTLVRLKHNKGVIAAAGMPPVYLYSEKIRAVEKVIHQAPPIGAFYDFPYPHQEMELTKGDILLLLSDGLPELVNPAEEMFGYSRLKQLFAEIGGKTPGQIIDDLVAAGDSWLKGKPQEDDMTFVVLNVK